jgi:hypothetical protein
MGFQDTGTAKPVTAPEARIVKLPHDVIYIKRMCFAVLGNTLSGFDFHDGGEMPLSAVLVNRCTEGNVLWIRPRFQQSPNLPRIGVADNIGNLYFQDNRLFSHAYHTYANK